MDEERFQRLKSWIEDMGGEELIQALEEVGLTVCDLPDELLDTDVLLLTSVDDDFA